MNNISSTLTYDEAKSRICVQLINYAHHMEEIGHLPYILKEDLAVVFCYSTEKPEDSTLITSADMQKWGIDLFQLYRNALLTSREIHPAVYAPMKDLLGLPDDDPGIPMYVLSCRDDAYGSSAVLYPDVLACIAAELRDNLFLIPSSIHEMILLRAQDVFDTDGLIGIIHEINMTEVLPGEVLSDSLYYYERAQDSIRRVERRSEPMLSTGT